VKRDFIAVIEFTVHKNVSNKIEKRRKTERKQIRMIIRTREMSKEWL
jgi:hypothetical protein